MKRDSCERTGVQRFARSLVWLPTCVLTAACSAPPLSDQESETSARNAIVGGAADTSHTAVAALIHSTSAGVAVCGGTTVATKGKSGIFLTAAHCVVELDPNTGQVATPVQVSAPETVLVVPGEDWLASGEQAEFYEALSIRRHPQYDGTAASPYDVAIVQYAGALPDAPTIPLLSEADDDLAVGSAIELVGYGMTETDENNTQRYSVDQSVSELSALQFRYDQTNGKGTCHGDSGGPALYTTQDGLRVSGVVSSGDSDCAEESIAIRASAHEEFVQTAIGAIPEQLACGECALAAGAPGNTCHTESMACMDPSSPCNDLLACLAACGTAACEEACLQGNPTGTEQYLDYVTCLCRTDCASECGESPACMGVTCGGIQVSDTACNTCVRGSCCAEADACVESASCLACLQNPTPSCASNETFTAFTSCLASCEGDPCGVTSSGGSGGSGGSGAGGNAGNGNGNGGTSSGNAGGGGLPSPQGGASGEDGMSPGGAGAPDGAGSAGAPSAPEGGANSDPSAGSPSTGGDDDSDDDDDASNPPERSGCACSAPSPRGPASSPWLLALLVVALRRRATKRRH